MTLDDQEWKEHIEMLKASKQAGQGTLVAVTGSVIPSGDPEAICDDCGGANVVWFAPSPLWNKIVRQPDKADPMLCPRCFILRAELSGIGGVWMVSLESPNSEIRQARQMPAGQNR